MYLIYGRPGQPAALLVQWDPSERNPLAAYRVVNGGYYLTEMERGNRDRLWMAEEHLLRSDPKDVAYYRNPENAAVLQMEWGPTMTPRDNRAELSEHRRWDYNEVLLIASQLLAGGPVMTWAERLEAEAAERNPTPDDWDPEAFS